MDTISVLAKSEKHISREDTISVDFSCKRCSRRIEIPNGLNNISPQDPGHSSQNPLGNYDIVFINNFQVVAACNHKSSLLRPLLEESRDLGRLNVEVLDLMAESPKVDYPVCEDCTDNILDHMDHELEADEKDIDEYRQLLDRLEIEEAEDNEDDIRAEHQRLQELEASLLKEWSNLQTEEKDVKEQVRTLENDCDILEVNMNEMLKKQHIFDGKRLKSMDELNSIKKGIANVKSRSDKLNKAHVFRLGFEIICDCVIGKINGCRLGRLPDIVVTWTEINTAWGQVVLLLHSLSKLINFSHENYELVPLCNQSYVKVVNDQTVKLLPLFYSGDANSMKKKNEFDHAMVSFLNYLQKFKERVEKDQLFRLPYSIKMSKIIDRQTGIAYSIQLNLNTFENWTKALKLMLANLSWALAWASSFVGASSNL